MNAPPRMDRGQGPPKLDGGGAKMEIDGENGNNKAGDGEEKDQPPSDGGVERDAG